MNYPKFLFLALLALLLGCAQDTVQDDLVTPFDREAILSPLASYHTKAPPHNTHLMGTAVERPIKVQASGIMEIRPNPDACGPYYEVFISGKGVSSHLGSFYVTNNYCTDGVDPVSSITGIVTAANGDQFFVLVTDIWDNEADGERYIAYIITGGTGRFTDATGDYVLHGLVDFENLIWELVGEGTITY